MKFCVDMPYPKVLVEKEDPVLAQKLLSLMAGFASEDTCIHTYIYQMILLEANKDLKDILHGIAVVEMHHLEILGKLVKKLGLTPIFAGVYNNKLRWFSGEYVRYSKNLKEMLLDNIKAEENTIESYEKVINETTDYNIKHILKRIVLDERLHVEIFTKIYEQLTSENLNVEK